MKDFQIHAMRCTRDRIVVAGTEDARYVFDISGHEGRGPNADDDTDLASEGQLGWPVGGVKTLESFDPQHEYQLVLSNSTKDSEVTCVAEILQIDTHENDQRRRGRAVYRTTNRDATASAALAMSRF